MPPDNVAPDIWFPNLGIYFENVPRHLIGNDPDFSLIYFSGFPVNIYLYAVCIVIGIAAAAGMGFWYVHKCGDKVQDYVDLLILGVPLAVLGLRIYYLAFNWDLYSGQPFFRTFFDFRGGGLAIFGGIIGAAIAAAIMSFKKNIPFSVMADYGAPSMLLGQVIGRFGNFFNREAFGGNTDSLFAMRIRTDQAHYTTEELIAIPANGAYYYQVHPTFLYEASFNLVLMILLLIYRPHKKFDGEILLLYFLGYGIIRFFVEGLRTDQMPFFNTGLPLNQIMSVVFVVVSAGLIIAGHMRKRSPARRRRR